MMSHPRARAATRAVAAASAAVLLAGATSAAAPAAEGDRSDRQGTRSLATVLAADGTKFDKNWDDFDIAEKAVLAVLDAKPNSPVGLLTRGGKRATVFVPTDRAFRLLAGDLAGGKNPGSEYTTFKAVAGLGIDTVEAVLLYHVVPGRTLVSEKVVKARGDRLRTAAGARVGVRVNHEGVVSLVDKDRNDRNPRVVVLDVNRGNRQVAHATDRVLRPADL